MSGLNQQVKQQVWFRESNDRPSESVSPDARPGLLQNDQLRQNVNSLSKIIEAEIIPRLMLVHRSAVVAVPAVALERDSVDVEQVAEFARLILAHDVTVARAYVGTMLEDGFRLEMLYLDLFSPAARRLGEMWEADLCDFTQVTMALWRLQQLLHDLSPAFQHSVAATGQVRTVLLMPAPGEQHTFGLFMVAEFFRRAGWNVWSELPRSQEELLKTVRRHHFDVIGLSVAGECKMDSLIKSIKGIRGASQNSAVGVMVGGPMFIKQPELVEAVGADVTAIDGSKAVEAAEKLIAMKVIT